MPITQSRMIALVSAAQDYKQALDQVCGFITKQHERHTAGQITSDQACELLFSSANAMFLLAQPIESALAIVAEAKHFRVNSRRNERKAEKARENRLAERAGQPRPKRLSTAPKRIDRLSEQETSFHQRLHGSHKPDGKYEPDFGDEVDLGGATEPEEVIDENYVPKELTAERKAEIEKEMELAERQREFLERYGDPSKTKPAS